MFAVTRRAIPLSLALTACLVACTSRPSQDATTETKPQAMLTGKWQEVSGTGTKGHILVQFEFFADGTVIENQKILGKWNQLGAGSFKLMDASHLKVELQPSWAWGVVVYEVSWRNRDQLTLKAADKTIPLDRVLPN
jgi:hypothetical protein